ncbi:uncharacterized protein ACA1_394560 [Acanthamoeba castellanii str. Neff]|uniref:Secreted protein n=1 Tax=Acanthamoeba castellanii (strain ATCC 30010 / Neff) TaxID=1257118 RepID=L8GZM5_ACACF|nr:uncharacterized protein ACA1_394560 [Acanthamoeba castellanii str. Neff]ELR18689.1 hypothetical protein ACA1_394560 [Acanthamoeba castellanii str. Neff]
MKLYTVDITLLLLGLLALALAVEGHDQHILDNGRCCGERDPGEVEEEGDYYWKCFKVCHTHRDSTTAEHPCTTTPDHEKPPCTTTEAHRTTTASSGSGQCANGQWQDRNGCCPRKIAHTFFYPDGHGCYPIATEAGVKYADGQGVLPDRLGEYLKAGEPCPEDRKCKKECDRV